MPDYGVIGFMSEGRRLSKPPKQLLVLGLAGLLLAAATLLVQPGQFRPRPRLVLERPPRPLQL